MHENTIKKFLVVKNFTKNLVLFGMETLCLLFAIIRCFFKVKRFLEISSFPHEEFHFFLVPHEELKTEENTTCIAD